MNISKLEELLKSFYQISGMEIIIIDNNFHTLLSVTHSFNHFCSEIHQCSECTEACKKSDNYYFNISKKEQRLIKYTCPFGLFTFLSPIKKDGEVVAALVMAPAIEEKDDSDIIPLSAANSLIPDIDVNEFKKLIKRIPHYTREKLNAFSELLLLLTNTIERENLLETSRMSIAALTKSYIDNNLSRKITLADISWNLHYSTVTITTKFKKEYGISIMNYIINERMKLAEKLLKNKTHTVTSVAQACGFSDVEYFSRAFKKFHGTSPSRWNQNAT